MKTIVQAFRDLKKEIVWVLLYGVLASVVLSSLIGSISGLRQNLPTARFMIGFRLSDADMLVVESAGSYRIPENSGEKPAPTTVASLNTLLQEGLSKDGKLGGTAILPSVDTKLFQSTALIVGRAVDTIPVDVPKDRAPVLAVSEAQSDLLGTSVRIGNETLPIEATVPNGTMIGTLYYHTRSGDLDGSLFVLARDYADAYRVLGCGTDSFLLSLTVADEDDAYRAELLQAVVRSTGMHARIWPTKSYLKLTGDAGMQQIVLRLIFFGVASFALIAAMVMNLLRVLDAHTNDYAVHRLFGATGLQTFFRMLLLSVGFNLIPAVWIALRTLIVKGWIGKEDGTGEMRRGFVAASPEKLAVMGAALAALFVLILSVSLIGFLRFQTAYQKGMRRE